MKAGFSGKGIRLVVAEIHLPDALQKALIVVDKQRLEAEASAYEAIQRSQEVAGTVIQMFCLETGMSEGKVKRLIMADSQGFIEKYREVWDKSWDATIRRMGIDGNAYLDIRTSNALLDLIAVFQRMPKGGGGSSSPSSSKKDSRKDPKGGEAETDEDGEYPGPPMTGAQRRAVMESSSGIKFSE